MGGTDLRRGRFSVKMYVKTNELGAHPLDPPMIMDNKGL